MRIADLPPRVRETARAALEVARAPRPRRAEPQSAPCATSVTSDAAIAPLTLVVPLPPHVTNTGGSGKSRHWSLGNREKRQYWEWLDVIAYLGSMPTADDGTRFGIPPAPAVPLHRVQLTAHLVLAGAMDDDNALARCKPLVDWLVARCYLATDRRERKRDGAGCRWLALPTQTVTRKEPPRVELTITPICP